MIVHDVTLPISPALPVWPGDVPVDLRRTQDRGLGDPCNTSALSLSAHCGTHVDAPLHYLDGGAGVDALDLGVLVGPCRVADAGDGTLDAARLAALGLPRGTERLLLRTQAPGSPPTAGEADGGLDVSGAAWIVAAGIRLVGIDRLSIATGATTDESHRLLLRAGVVIVEGLALSGVAPGAYELACLPLKLQACDGAPARVVLVER
jgi:arylformamidase